VKATERKNVGPSEMKEVEVNGEKIYALPMSKENTMVSAMFVLILVGL
jgi:hypothetical protein